MAGLLVRTAWGSDEPYPTATDWDVDHNHDLTIVIEVEGAPVTAVAVYPAGQWLRVTLTP